MHSDQINLVQQSFKQVEPIAETAAALFYDRLFTLDPTLRPLFKGDLKEQGKKLMQALSIVVKGINRIDKILPAVQELGRRHASYGVEDVHYNTVGAALLWTLEQGLGKAFTSDVQEAWTAAYGLLSGAMREAALEVSQA